MMAYYLVHAHPKPERFPELEDKLRQDAFRELRPFGTALTAGLEGMRRADAERVAWEEECHCSPPLAMERASVLDRYFDEFEFEVVEQGAGWKQIEDLPRAFND